MVPIYHPMQFEWKLRNQTLENDEKPNLDPILNCLHKFWAPMFFLWVLLLLVIVPSYDPMQSKEKQMNQTWENSENSKFGSYFGLFCQNGPQVLFCTFYVY